MSNCETIHETVVRDIVDVITDVKDSGELVDIFGKDKSIRSISQASSNLILVFPVLVSRSIDIDNAAMVTKAIERKCVSMMQILFSAVSLTKATDAISYVKQYHTNLSFSGGDVTVDEFIDVVDKIAVELESAGLATINHARYDAVLEDMRNLAYVLPETISESSINDFRVRKSPYTGEHSVVKRMNYYTEDNRGGTDHDVNKYKYTPKSSASSSDTSSASTSSNQHIGGNFGGTRGPNGRNVSPTRNNTSGSSGGSIGRTPTASDRAKYGKDAGDYYRNQLLDSDVKKANELVPTLMYVNFVSYNGSGEPVPFNDVVVGIKAKMYPVDSADMINRLKLKNQDNNGFIKFLRASTREISFFKDFIFAIDKAKLDAISNSNRGSSSKMWKVLERRSLKSKIRRSLRQTNDATAISTIVISQDEVEFLKRENINLEDPRVMRPIMESYNLMGACIIDESLEIAKFLDDTGDDNYETVSFRHLEREASDSSYKKVVNLMTKMTR